LLALMALYVILWAVEDGLVVSVPVRYREATERSVARLGGSVAKRTKLLHSTRKSRKSLGFKPLLIVGRTKKSGGRTALGSAYGTSYRRGKRKR